MPEVYKLIDCRMPCTMFKMQQRILSPSSIEEGAGTLYLKFPETTTISTDQYSYTWLNLVAEVGGYVGLFLGYSVYQMTDLIDMLLQKNWVECLKKVYETFAKNDY